MSAYARIQWLHKKIDSGCYPNSVHVVEKFGISQRQAQRDFETLKNEIGAPIKYSSERRGYYYTAPFELPATNEENETEYVDIVSTVEEQMRSDVNELQLRLPYSAQIRIKDKLTVMNMRPFITAQKPRHTYECEFQSVEMFLGAIMAMDSDIKILSPDWLRTRLLNAAERIVRNNK